MNDKVVKKLREDRKFLRVRVKTLQDELEVSRYETADVRRALAELTRLFSILALQRRKGNASK